MKFYDIEFLKSQAGLSDYLRYIFIFGSLVVLVIVFAIYIKHRIKTKYRDLSIILLLFIILEIGIQYSNYQINQLSILNLHRWLDSLKESLKMKERIKIIFLLIPHN